MLILGIFIIILQFMDIITTNLGIKRGCQEVNPLVRGSLESGFPLYLIFIKIGLATLVTFFLSLGIVILNWIFLALDIFLFIVVINNIININIQKKWNRIYNTECGNLMKFNQVFKVRDWIILTKIS